MTRILDLKLLTTILLLLFSQHVFAYIDPGTGSYLIQVMIALIAGLVFYLRHPIDLIRLIIQKLKKKK